MEGWAFLACSIWALGGIQLLSLGVIGEYVGKSTTKRSGGHRFIIADVLDAAEDTAEEQA